ncbi:NYN domain-containing protein [Burkholderia ubonensis]|uniref:NYN domain-containing protein n=1 Tax=Burkholderia ubonensis TaxID=101571 RepID=UPI0009B4B5A8|nr:NYN domain-containing protein [Burkholderia ubonensis]
MSVNLTKIGVFFDGSYFSSASAYYLYHHERRARIGVGGIRNYVTHQVAREEGVAPRHCRIVEAHLFAGRMSAYDARERVDDALYRERCWDEILQKEDVTAHYMPFGLRGEKGIDVSLALECYEAVVLKGLDVVVLVTGDGDFVPLVRKLNARGVRVMVIGWTYSYLDNANRERGATMSRALIAEATYPIRMDELIDGYGELPDEERALVDRLFLRRRDQDESGPAPVDTRAAPDTTPETAPVTAPERAPMAPQATPRQSMPERGPAASRESLERFAKQGFSAGRDLPTPAPKHAPQEDRADRVTGRVTRVLDGYGFIKSDWGDANPFFHHSEVADSGFDHMQPGTPVSYIEVQGERGMVAQQIRILETA